MRRLQYIKLLFFILLPALLSAQIRNTAHNLSTSGSGDIRSESEGEICIFCHTSHSPMSMAPLWNRKDPGSIYKIYDGKVSSTMQALPGQPDGTSILCLSCHDGTVALGNISTRSEEITFANGYSMLNSETNMISTDLSDDHPISFIYDNALAASDGQLRNPESIKPPISLESNKVQCTTCHDPHFSQFSKFLRSSPRYSDLCISCHNIAYWTESAHSTSTAKWSKTNSNPWEHITEPFETVAENACLNCHNNHNAAGKERLMKSNREEDNCFDCHNGNTAAIDIKVEFSKPYTHNVYRYNDIHDAAEPIKNNTKHIECEDCHNPHASNNKKASAPNISGPLVGVKGVTENGTLVNPASFEYEICFRCHADNVNSSSRFNRKIDQVNLRLEFDTSNPSYHPVTGSGTNDDVPSLIHPLTVSSIIYCTDCHASDGGKSSGPHGSIYPQILKDRYETDENTIESMNSYKLCYNCHDRMSILNDDTFKRHNLHIKDENTTCSVCHDPHGISSSQGNSSNNSNLINFDTKFVSADRDGNLQFEDTGYRTGYCLLVCHGKAHNSSMRY